MGGEVQEKVGVGLEYNMDGIYKNAPLVYYGIGGLIDVVHQKLSAIDYLCLCHLNDM
jgi:hypothetical protein